MPESPLPGRRTGWRAGWAVAFALVLHPKLSLEMLKRRRQGAGDLIEALPKGHLVTDEGDGLFDDAIDIMWVLTLDRERQKTTGPSGRVLESLGDDREIGVASERGLKQAGEVRLQLSAVRLSPHCLGDDGSKGLHCLDEQTSVWAARQLLMPLISIAIESGEREAHAPKRPRRAAHGTRGGAGAGATGKRRGTAARGRGAWRCKRRCCCQCPIPAPWVDTHPSGMRQLPRLAEASGDRT